MSEDPTNYGLSRSATLEWRQFLCWTAMIANYLVMVSEDDAVWSAPLSDLAPFGTKTSEPQWENGFGFRDQHSICQSTEAAHRRPRTKPEVRTCFGFQLCLHRSTLLLGRQKLSNRLNRRSSWEVKRRTRCTAKNSQQKGVKRKSKELSTFQLPRPPPAKAKLINKIWDHRSVILIRKVYKGHNNHSQHRSIPNSCTQTL